MIPLFSKIINGKFGGVKNYVYICISHLIFFRFLLQILEPDEIHTIIGFFFLKIIEEMFGSLI